MEKYRLTCCQLLAMSERDKRAERNALYLILLGAVAGAAVVLCFVGA